MSRFRVGDRVRMVEPQSKYTGQRGTVVIPNTGISRDHIAVQFDCNAPGHSVVFPEEYFERVGFNMKELREDSDMLIKLKSNLPYEEKSSAGVMKYALVNKGTGRVISLHTDRDMAEHFVDLLNSGKVLYYRDRYELREVYDEN